MIKYALYVWHDDLNEFCFLDQIEYQTRIDVDERIIIHGKCFKVVLLDHDLDANVVDLYLKESS